MLAAFWSGLGGELAKQWAARILTPAFAFWTGGATVVWWSAHGHRVARNGWTAELQATAHPLEQLSTVAQVVLIVGTLVLMAGSALIADRLTLPLLKLLEGYWPWPAWLRALLVRYRRWRRGRWSKKVSRLWEKQARGDLTPAEEKERQSLTAKDRLTEAEQQKLAEFQAKRAQFSAAEMAELGRGVALLRSSPREDALGMPTRLGDILRAAESRPHQKYGLDAVVCWYRLWMLLPAEIKTEVSQSRLQIDQSVRAWLWGALFIVWAPWLWWVAVPVAIVVPLITYNFGMLGAAALFGDLTETAFDLYRMRLYDSLLLPRPTSPADERVNGERLTAILWRGEDDPRIVYVAAPPPANDAE